MEDLMMIQSDFAFGPGSVHKTKLIHFKEKLKTLSNTWVLKWGTSKKK